MATRLAQILQDLRGVMAVHRPTVAAIEAIFSHKSATSALVLGQARGVALAALAEGGLTVHEYNASVIKQSVTGSGKADKDQIGRMVDMLLGEAIVGGQDARDACAIAMTHHLHAGRIAAVGVANKPRRKLDPRSPASWGIAVVGGRAKVPG